ncbi:pathogenesis-related protein [Scenedesmus sp. PABB004]|nr:pathogenesis-related protein [Scenedesmus sp. PABB004]
MAPRHHPLRREAAALLLTAMTVAAARELRQAEPTGAVCYPPPHFSAEQAAAAASGAAAASAAGAAPAVAPPALYTAIVAQHNAYRRLHGSPALEWDDYLMEQAQRVALKCRWEHDTNKYEYGQNLACMTAGMKSFAKTLDWAVGAWYSEEKLYDYAAAVWNPAAGHFTALVWKSTTRVGCWITTCPQLALWGDQAADFVVCNYQPPGNITPFFRENVLRPTGGEPPPSPSPAPPRASPNPSPSPGEEIPEPAEESILRAGASLHSDSGNDVRWCCPDDPRLQFGVARTGELMLRQVCPADGSVACAPGSLVKLWGNGIRRASSKGPFTATLAASGLLRVRDSTGAALRGMYNASALAGHARPFRLVVEAVGGGRVALYDGRGACVWASAGAC